jgi:hypothetical protein
LPHRIALIALLALSSLAAAAERPLAPLPAFVRGVWYPLDARHDGQAFDGPRLAGWAREAGLNTLALTVAAGPGLSDTQAALDAAQAAGLKVLIRPVPDGDPATADLLRQRYGSHPALAAWAVALPNAAVVGRLRTGQPRRPVLGLVASDEAAGFKGQADALLFAASTLFQPAQGFADWGRRLARARETFGGPVLATIEAAPPDWYVERQALALAAPAHPDLWRTARQRPQTTAAHAGEYLLVPEPAQIRLQTYAAVGNGADGVLFDGAGHLLGDGPEPFVSVDRAAEVALLGAELRLLEPFLAARGAQPAVAPDGVGAGVRGDGGGRVLLAWRDRRLDTRAVGGGTTGPVALIAPAPQPWRAREVALRVDRLDPGGLAPQPVDWRPEGLRVELAELDLSVAYVLAPGTDAHQRWREAAGQELAEGLPVATARALVVADRRFAKVRHTADRLAKARQSAGGGALGQALTTLQSAVEARRYGYVLTACELAREAERLTRVAQAAELEPLLLRLPPAQRAVDAVLSFAGLPWLWERRARTETAPYALPLALGFDDLKAGALPPRWQATRGFDQTVATLAAGEGVLRWQPRGADPGALSLPFDAATTLDATLRLRVLAPVGSRRLILLAPAAEAAPIGGLVVQPDGTVAGFPSPGATARYEPGRWHQVALKLAGGKLTTTFDGQPVGTPVATDSSAGALVLAKLAGADEAVIEVEEVRVSRP